MVITRNEMDFVLTDDELFCAYKEQQHAWDLSQMRESYDLLDLVRPREARLITEALADRFYEDLAYNYRDLITKWGAEDEETLDEAEGRALRFALAQLSGSLGVDWTEPRHEQP